MSVKENLERTIDRYFDGLRSAIEKHADEFEIRFYKDLILSLHEQYIKYCEKESGG